MRTAFLSVMCALSVFGTRSYAEAGAPLPPAQIERQSHLQWLGQIKAPVSPYHDWAFRWYEEQLSKTLPAAVNADPDKLYVPIEGALAEAVRAETAGDVEEGTSYGLETYAVVDAPVHTVLDAILFRWGKPVGREGGTTYPNDTVFGYREEKTSPEWGPGSYKTFTVKKNGGVAKDVSDSFSLLVRGSEASGYVLVGDFLAPVGESSDTSFITVIMIRALPGNKTDYRVAGLLTGQNYSFFGLDMGRKNFGFNAKRIREGQKDFLSQVAALKNTGKIPERKPEH